MDNSLERPSTRGTPLLVRAAVLLSCTLTPVAVIVAASFVADPLFGLSAVSEESSDQNIQTSVTGQDSQKTLRHLDPAGWGTDHVGKPFPEYITGDECLFCHRKIGERWSENRHQLTIRPATLDEPAVRLLWHLTKNKAGAEPQYLLGSRHITRFLKRSKAYGKLSMLSTSFVPPMRNRDTKSNDRKATLIGELKNQKSPHWDTKTFGARCAGCHTTAVNPASQAFSALSLDCFTCHGDVQLEHTKDISRVLLSKKNRVPRQVNSICAQCHLRGGKSKSNGRPYPNTFVAGDNLFQDFKVDLSDAAITALPIVEQHIYLSARDVAVYGNSKMDCLTCHSVHSQSSEKHQQLNNTSLCASCHIRAADKSKLRNGLTRANRLLTHSRVCNY